MELHALAWNRARQITFCWFHLLEAEEEGTVGIERKWKDSMRFSMRMHFVPYEFFRARQRGVYLTRVGPSTLWRYRAVQHVDILSVI